MRKVLSMLLCLLFFIGSVVAQEKTVSGVVLSAEDGSPIIGATIVAKGGAMSGTVTDFDGNFSLKVGDDVKQIEVSYVGMTSQTVAAGQNLKVVLATDAELLDEVIVTAMGIKRSEKALGFSATSVNSEEITASRTSDVMTGLAGKVAGVSISSTSSDPGTSTSVIIRGVSSLSGNNQPLYVIDGVPMNNSTVASSDQLNTGYDFGNGASAVNPDNVESMTILKGAAATALYGSRAAGGVVIITTKTGKKNEGLGIEYNGGLQWSSLLRIPQMQNEFGMGWYGDKTDDENGSWGPRFDGTTQVWGTVYDNSQKIKAYEANENNIEEFFETGFRYSNSLSFNGATDKSDYFVSFSQVSDDGMIPTDADTYDKYTFSANGSHTIGKLKVSSSVNYANQKNSYATTGQGFSMYNCIMQTPRDISIISLADLDDPFNTPGYYYTPYSVTNPYYILENYMSEYESERIYGKFQVDYDITSKIKAMYRFGMDSSTGQQYSGEPGLYTLYADTPNGIYGSYDGETGSYSEQITRRHEYNNDAMVSYNDNFGDFGLNVLVGFNGNERYASYLASSITNLTIPTWYNLSNSADPVTTSTYESLRRLYGVYAQVEASYQNMFYLTATARNDWSSTLPEGNNSFFYPGVTGSYIFSENLSDEAKDIISFGKIRAAWGKTGNDADPYMVDAVYAQSSAYGYWSDYSFPYSSSGYNAYTVSNVLGSSTLSPEMTTESEVGANIAFFNNRINIDAAYYYRVTDKQVFSLSMDPSSGYTYQNTNIGEVENKGIELLISAVPIKTKDFAWSVSWNYSKNDSKVLSLPEEMGGEAAIYALSGGIGLYAVTGEELGVFKAEVPKMTEDGQIVVDAATGLPVAEDDQQIVGSMNYDYSMGFNTTFTYKGVSLSADIDVRQGGLMYSRTKDISYFTGNAIQTAYNDRNAFIIPNSVNEVTDDLGNVTYVENTTALDNTYIYDYWEGGGSDLDSGFLVDKSYVKLRSVVIGWELPKKWLLSTPFQAVRVSAYGNNLLLWTPSSNTFMDPESTSFGNDLTGFYGEWSSNPSSRNYGLNLMVKF